MELQSELKNETLYLDSVQYKLLYAEYRAEECRKMAELYRMKAEKLKKGIRAKVISKYLRRPMLGHRINTLVDIELSISPYWKSYVANNQWYIQQALMYSNEVIMLKSRK